MSVCKKLTGEASFAATCFRIQHRLDGSERARREFIVVPLIAGCCSGKHDEIAILAARRALIWIVLQEERKKLNLDQLSPP